MLKKAAVLVAGLLLLGPSVGLVSVATLMSPAATGSCTVPLGPDAPPSTGEPLSPEKPPETRKVVIPLPAGTYVQTDGFGWREEPITGLGNNHTGLDLAAADGTAIMAAADGVVTVAEFSAGWGGLIVIEHTIKGQTIATAYAHMWRHGIHVTPGQKVAAGQHIGDVGSSGNSTGAHLHFEVRPGGSYATAIDPVPWLASHGAALLDGAEGGGPVGCGVDTEDNTDTDADTGDTTESTEQP